MHPFFRFLRGLAIWVVGYWLALYLFGRLVSLFIKI